MVQRVAGTTLMECQRKLREKMALELRLKNEESRGAEIPKSSAMAGLRECMVQNHVGEVSKGQILGACVGHSKKCVCCVLTVIENTGEF